MRAVTDLAADAVLVFGVVVTGLAMRWRRLAGASCLALTLIGIYARYVEPYWFETTHTTIAWHGPRLRVALLSDLHIGRAGPWKTREAVARAMAAKPDVIVLAGDYISGWKLDARKLEIFGELGRLRAPLGVFAALGNHDTEPWGDAVPRRDAITARLAELGITVLRNESRAVGGATLPVTLIGLGDHEALDTDAARAFAGAAGGPRIVLTHNWRSLRAGVPRFDVALAGHTHGGQVCVPLVDWCPRGERFGPYLRGLHPWPAGGQLFVSRGTAESFFRARLAARPEVSVIDLVPVDGGDSATSP
jgi:uncharacterized protein